MANTITIHNQASIGADREASQLLIAVLERALRHVHQDGSTADIYCDARGTQNGSQSPEWLEFGLRVQYATGGSLYIGCIQRTKGANFEFHS